MESNLDAFKIPSPPEWSLMTGEIGKGLVIAAVVLYLISILSWIFQPKVSQLAKVGSLSFILANLSVVGTFASLATLFVNNRFEYRYIWEHSDNRNAVMYRFAGIWSGQQGSFLLWATCSAVFGLITLKMVGEAYRRWYVVAYSVFLGMITAILAFETPFHLNTIEGKPFVPSDGFGLAPSLQNYWVTIHPPVIFLGFGSLTALFALAFSALMIRNYSDWLRAVRPLSIVSLTLVGLGLCMGGFWAYETLGWGGFWMWDPVENVSFVPWCFLIALVHGLVVQAAKKKWMMANLLLAGAPFLMFVYGTFLTRSGLLSDASVHSFAEMDSSALKLLVGVMGITVFGFLGLWGTRVWQSRRDAVPTNEALTRDRWMLLGIWSSVLLGLATFVGMSVPLIMALRGQKPSVVQEGLYHQVLPYVFIPLMTYMGVAPFLSWKKSDPKKVWSKVYSVACIAIGLSAMLLFAAITTKYSANINLAPKMTLFGRPGMNGLFWMMFLISLCNFAVVASIWSAAERWKRSLMGASGFFAHVGVAVLMLGLIVSRGFESKGDGMLMADHPANILGYKLQYAGMTSNDKDRDNKVLLDVYRGKDKLYTAQPGMYRTTMGDGQETVMVWPYIYRGWLHDTYISLGQPQTQGTQEVTVPVGKTVAFGDLKIKYTGLDVQGTPGQAGTKFGAKIEVTGKETTKNILPQLELQPGGPPKQIPAPLDNTLNLVMTAMNAADKTVTLRIDFTTPMFPVEVFHKPFTNLVFLGTLIMTVAGAMATWNRRPTQTFKSIGSNDSAIEEQTAPDGELIGTGNIK